MISGKQFLTTNGNSENRLIYLEIYWLSAHNFINKEHTYREKLKDMHIH